MALSIYQFHERNKLSSSVVNLSSLSLLRSILSQVDSFPLLCFLMGWPHPPHLPPTAFIPCKTTVTGQPTITRSTDPSLHFHRTVQTVILKQEVLALLPNCILQEGHKQARVKIQVTDGTVLTSFVSMLANFKTLYDSVLPPFPRQ